jgi:hypothetical protein
MAAGVTPAWRAAPQIVPLGRRTGPSGQLSSVVRGSQAGAVTMACVSVRRKTLMRNSWVARICRLEATPLQFSDAQSQSAMARTFASWTCAAARLSQSL